MERSVKTGDDVVTCFRDGVVTLRKNRRVRGYTESLKEIGYQGIIKGDLVIHTMDAFAGATGVSDSDGKGTSVYSVCTPRNECVNPYYYAFCVREMARSEWILAHAKGIRERSTDFRFNVFASQIVPFPPLPEQTIIVSYLNQATEHIHRYLNAKERLINLLEEQRQTVIQRAVTRGLDPSVRVKPSGTEWLGDVPVHWEVTAVKKHFTIQLGKMLQNRPNTPDDVEVPYLKAQHIQWFQVRTEDAPKMWASQNELDQYGIAPGDLLVCEGGEGGRCGILKQNADGYIIQNALHRVRPRRQNRNDFLQYIMSAIATTGWFDALNDKATIAHFTREKFSALRILLPPLTEQNAIVEYLEKTTADINTAICRARHEIELLKEYRTRLIADVVTGKLDVREAIFKLPEAHDELSISDKPELQSG